jgi:putative peptidoglycan lipid II flippase
LAPDPAPAASVARSAASAGAATMTSRILGVVREQVLAYYFGASAAMDAYLVAFRFPNLLRDLFAEGAMSAAFVPTFSSELATKGKDSAFRLGNYVANALVLITAVAVVLGIVFAEPLVRAFAGGFMDVPGKMPLTVQLTRIMLPFLTFVALAAAFMGMANALHHFFVPAVSPAMFNVSSIVCTIALIGLMSSLGLPPITAAAIGALVGGFTQWAVQWPLLHREGFRYRPILDWRDPALRRVLLLMGPGTIGLAAVQVNLFVNTWLAAREPGAVSWLNLTFRLMYLPIGLFGVSIATATTPAIARQLALGERATVRRTIADGLVLMMMLNVPATVGLLVLAEPIIRLMYERGAFLPSDTIAAAAALQFYAIGLLGYSVVKIASPAFYALGQSRVPVAISFISVLANAALNFALVGSLGYRGLALGTSVASLLNAALLLVMLHRRLGGIEAGAIVDGLARIGAATALMGVATFGANALLTTYVPGGGILLQVVRLGTTIAVSLAVLGAAAHVLRVPQFAEGMALITRRLSRLRGSRG